MFSDICRAVIGRSKFDGGIRSEVGDTTSAIKPESESVNHISRYKLATMLCRQSISLCVVKQVN